MCQWKYTLDMLIECDMLVCKPFSFSVVESQISTRLWATLFRLLTVSQTYTYRSSHLPYYYTPRNHISSTSPPKWHLRCCHACVVVHEVHSKTKNHLAKGEWPSTYCILWLELDLLSTNLRNHIRLLDEASISSHILENQEANQHIKVL